MAYFSLICNSNNIFLNLGSIYKCGELAKGSNSNDQGKAIGVGNVTLLSKLFMTTVFFF